MSKDQPYLPRPGVDERVIVNEMIRDLSHEHWEECYTFVQWRVRAKAKNIFHHFRDDLVQEIMFKITKYLPHFLFQCTLKTWLNTIINNHIIDKHRQQHTESSHLPLLINLPGEADADNVESGTGEVASTEETFELQEQIRLGVEALQEYAKAHSNPIRDWHIIQMVILEGRTYEEAAIAVGCHAPVVGYVVREAQRYARRKLTDSL